MQEINAWLVSEQNFRTGADLYIKYGSNNFLKDLLRNDPTPYTLEKLEAELKLLASTQPAINDCSKIKIETPSTPFEPIGMAGVQEEKKVEANTGELQRYFELTQMRDNLYRQLDRNMMELDRGTQQSFLHMTAKNILSLYGKVRDIWKVLDIFNETGKLPTIRTEIVLSAKKEIQLLRVSIWKAKERLASVNCRDIVQTKQLIERNKNRILQLGGKVKS